MPLTNIHARGRGGERKYNVQTICSLLLYLGPNAHACQFISQMKELQAQQEQAQQKILEEKEQVHLGLVLVDGCGGTCVWLRACMNACVMMES